MRADERRDRLVRLLRRRTDWTVDRLATELEVSRRTVLRDLGRLRERGYGIVAMSGPGGGVHLDPGSVMVTSRLATEEVVALILSVALSRAAPWVPFAAGADHALAKIEAALPQRRVIELRRVMDRVMIGDPVAGAADASAVDPRLVATFEAAFTDERVLAFGYTDARGRTSTRRVEPHGLLVRPPLWYVIAWDRARDAARLFRADRIRRPRVSDEAFRPRPHDLVAGVCPDARPAGA